MRRLHWGGRGSKERILHEVVDTDKERGIMSPNKFARRHLCMAPEAALSLSLPLSPIQSERTFRSGEMLTPNQLKAMELAAILEHNRGMDTYTGLG